ncbi:cyclic nucleotide-binding domain-containing protein [Sandaracinus amylolyticus]|uniref:cyclic nucleotide-binding domain-containing protein n=1 Tax=Sandaracinus amylolyticus TaxID=927083 RepID=UPI001F35DD99|nr:cyclic nucleotide-binding domain-containing protein [Sandaracinus amylolyticus]UJR79234.1 Cyclic nucleotide-binding domain-containing protein [Sandaracinus amylolyticus]
MRTLRDLRAHADARLLAGDAHAALHAYCALVQLQPVDLDARLRVADSLLALGEVQRAAVVYTALARYATHAGYPLRALVALKVLTALEPQLEALLAPLAELYSVDSPRLGRGVRLAPGDPDQLVPETLDLARQIPLDQLAPHAERVAADTAGAAFPERLPPIPLFSELRGDAFRALLPALKLRRVRPGEVVLAEGEPGQSFFVIARGEVQVTKKLAQHPEAGGGDTVLATLHEGAIFGEMALVSAAPRSATVRASTDADLLEFDRDALAALSRDVATLAVALDKFTRERLLQNLLQTSPLFRPLDRKQRMDLVRRFTAHDVGPGVPIITEGQPGRGLFVLLSGEVDVSKIDGDSKILLATLKPGDVFGEISLLNDEPATATVTAARQSTVLFLGRDIFQRLVAAFPEIREYISQLGEERQLDTRLLLETSEGTEELDLEDLVLV